MAEHRFPCEQHKYLQSVGKILPRILERIFLEMGFGVWVNPGQGNGVDLELYGISNRPVLVAEVLNWSPYSMMPKERIQCIIDNLTAYNCNRLLVYTAMFNEDLLESLSDFDITTLKIGYQVLTLKKYKFFEARNQVVGRKIYTPGIMRDVKTKVLDCLESLEMYP